MSLRRSRGIHAARPTARRLRSACTQVAILWCLDDCALRSKGKSKGKSKSRSGIGLGFSMLPVAVRLAGGGDLEDVTAGKPDCYRSDAHSSSRVRVRVRVTLIFMRNSPDTTNRDLGAG